ncbi:hypothetical protein ACV2BY_20160 [Salmonella enterica subsp. enterica serovar Muenchen]
MRIMLNQVNIDGTIVIGEGEIEATPHTHQLFPPSPVLHCAPLLFATSLL